MHSTVARNVNYAILLTDLRSCQYEKRQWSARRIGDVSLDKLAAICGRISL